MGLSIGSKIKIVRNGFGMPLLLFSRDTVIAVSKKEAEKIYVTQQGGNNE